MANTNQQFLDFNKEIKLNDIDRNKLIISRDSLRQRMKANYVKIPLQERDNIILEFQSQGSFVTDTIIKPINDDFDLDDGVYFQGHHSSEKRPLPQVFHNWVIKSVDQDNDYEKVTDKDTCVRVKYKQKFHIDLPIYYVINLDSPELANKSKGWTLSSPVEFIAWFEEKIQSGFKKEYLIEMVKYAEPYEKWLSDVRKKDHQMRRLVRYLKAWGNANQNSTMPCGLIFTILVAENYSKADRDDVAFFNTLLNIRNYLLSNNITCPRPTTPIGEDLMQSLTENEKAIFMKLLNNLIDSAHLAINHPNEIESCDLLRKQLGTRFPKYQSNNSSESFEKPIRNIEILKRTAEKSTPWSPNS